MSLTIEQAKQPTLVKDSSQSVTWAGFLDSQPLVLLDPSPAPPISTPGPTPPTFQWKTYALQGDWPYNFGSGVMMTFHTPEVIFRCDPTYPNFNPSQVVFSCIMTTASDPTGKHFWQTSNPTKPAVYLTVMGKSGYPIVLKNLLGTIDCRPWNVLLTWTQPFDYSLWDQIDYCLITVGNIPQAYWMDLG